MDTIIEYKGVSAQSSNKLSEKVNNLIVQNVGWQPFGSISLTSAGGSDYRFGQAVVKYAEAGSPTIPTEETRYFVSIPDLFSGNGTANIEAKFRPSDNTYFINYLDGVSFRSSDNFEDVSSDTGNTNTLRENCLDVASINFQVVSFDSVKAVIDFELIEIGQTPSDNFTRVEAPVSSTPFNFSCDPFIST